MTARRPGGWHLRDLLVFVLGWATAVWVGGREPELQALREALPAYRLAGLLRAEKPDPNSGGCFPRY